MATPTLITAFILILVFVFIDIFFALSLKKKSEVQSEINKALAEEIQKLQSQIEKNVLEDKIRDQEMKRIVETQKELLTHDKMTDILLTKIQTEIKGRS